MNLQFCKMTCLQRKIQKKKKKNACKSNQIPGRKKKIQKKNACKSNQISGRKLPHLARTKFNFHM